MSKKEFEKLHPFANVFKRLDAIERRLDRLEQIIAIIRKDVKVTYEDSLILRKLDKEGGG